MPSDYEYDLPSFSDSSWGSSGLDTNDYSFSDSSGSGIPSASEYRQEDDWSSGWFTDSTAGQEKVSADEPSMFDGVWKWLGSSQGSATAASAIDAMMKMWAANKAEKTPWESMNTEAILKDKRIKAHNDSINQSWVPSMRELQR